MMQQRQGDYEGMTTEERGSSQEFRNDPLETRHIGGRDAPTSQVGYGGGDRTSELEHNPEGEHAHSVVERHDSLGEGKVHSDPVLSEDRPVMATNENDGVTDGNARPTDSGFGSSGPGGYVGEGAAHRSSDPTDLNARPPEPGFDGSASGEHVDEGTPSQHSRSSGITDANAQAPEPSESGYGFSEPGGYTGEGGSKVNDEGNPKSHQDTSDETALPHEAGKSLPGDYTEEGGVRRIPVTNNTEQYRDSAEHYGGLPAPTRPPGAVRDENHFDGPKNDNEPTTTTGADQPSPKEMPNMAPASTEASDGHNKEGLMAKIKSHLPGHQKHHAGTPSQINTNAAEDEKPGCMGKMKDKLTPGHHHQHTKTAEQQN